MKMCFTVNVRKPLKKYRTFAKHQGVIDIAELDSAVSMTVTCLLNV